MTSDFIHYDKNGSEYTLKELFDSHLLNILKLIEKRAEEGIVLQYGGCDFNDIWYDEECLKGEEALSYMNYDIYLEEAKRRRLL